MVISLNLPEREKKAKFSPLLCLKKSSLHARFILWVFSLIDWESEGEEKANIFQSSSQETYIQRGPFYILLQEKKKLSCHTSRVKCPPCEWRSSHRLGRWTTGVCGVWQCGAGGWNALSGAWGRRGTAGHWCGMSLPFGRSTSWMNHRSERLPGAPSCHLSCRWCSQCTSPPGNLPEICKKQVFINENISFWGLLTLLHIHQVIFSFTIV